MVQRVWEGLGLCEMGDIMMFNGTVMGSVEKFKKFSYWRELPNILPELESGNVQKGLSSKAEGLLSRGAYSEYVSLATGQERLWRPFSTVFYCNLIPVHDRWEPFGNRFMSNFT